jgi:glycosyltransferase involved in cell wall biosynthesis
MRTAQGSITYSHGEPTGHTIASAGSVVSGGPGVGRQALSDLSQASNTQPAGGPVVSVVMPCLNEADTVAACVTRAREALAAAQIRSEVIVADNGSTDGSQDLARAAGARVIPVSARGYGAALMGGIEAAHGRFIVMGDADESYDFGESPKFVAKLSAGFDLVQGCRLPRGGGMILPGAMPFLHRWWGNPMFSTLARWWFRAPISDVNCGLRAFTRDAYTRLALQCTGMEFANEMIVRASLTGLRIGEVPITLHPDGRKAHPPHLRTFRDGWRTLRFYLLFSPRWLFLYPGLVLALLGATAAVAGFAGMRIGSAGLDVHTLLFGALMMIAGYQGVIFAVLTKLFATNAELLPRDPRLQRFTRRYALERGLMLGTLLVIIGVVLVVATMVSWAERDFGAMDIRRTMRLAIPGVLATVLGLQTILFVFFTGVLQLDRRVPQR